MISDDNYIYQITTKKIIENSVRPKNLFSIGIYFLIKENKIVYVGQTKSGIKRIYQHLNKKDFDSYSFFIIKDKKELDKIEAYFITKYRPIYNKSLNENYITIKALNTICKKIYGKKDIRKIKKIMKENNITGTNKNNTIMYNIKDQDVVIKKFNER